MTAWNKVIKSFCCPSDSQVALSTAAPTGPTLISGWKGYNTTTPNGCYGPNIVQLPRLDRNHVVSMGRRCVSGGYRR